MTRLSVGVDGGKSKTVSLIADRSGAILGWGRSGSADKAAVPLDDAIAAIVSAVDAAIDMAGASRGDLGVGCFGLAGADFPEDFAQLRDHIAGQNLAREVLIRNDAQIALRAASVDGVGLVVSAGTHTSLALRTPTGEEWFSGWSSVDGPGGAEAGRRVIQAVLRAQDGRNEPTALTEALFAATGLSPDALLRAVSRGEVDEPFAARLAPLLFTTHERIGDGVAGRIIVDLAREMALWILGLTSRFDLRAVDFEVYLTGGLFRAPGGLLRESLAAAVHATAPWLRLVAAEREPVVGALLEALGVANPHLGPEVVERLTTTAPPPSFFETT